MNNNRVWPSEWYAHTASYRRITPSHCAHESHEQDSVSDNKRRKSDEENKITRQLENKRSSITKNLENE